jgi:hypothetical protein
MRHRLQRTFALAILAVYLAAAGPIAQQGEQDSGSRALFESGKTWAAAGQADEAREAWNAALEKAQDAQTRVAILEALGESYQYGGELGACAAEKGEGLWGYPCPGRMMKLGAGGRLRFRVRMAV